MVYTSIVFEREDFGLVVVVMVVVPLWCRDGSGGGGSYGGTGEITEITHCGDGVDNYKRGASRW